MKTALVTGSTSGIGLQIGKDLLKLEYNVIFHGRNWTKLQDIIKKNSNYKSKINLWQADLSCNEYTDNIEWSYLEEIKKLDVLILNAGTTDRTNFDNITIDNWNYVLNTNLNIPFFVVQILKNKIRKNGRIIFISSILAEKPHSRSISCAVSKAGVNALVKNLVKEFAHKNITVNAIAPGFIDSKWHDSKSKAQINRIKKRIALKRFGTTAEVSSLVQEVIRNSYINGQILTIDGAYDYE